MTDQQWGSLLDSWFALYAFSGFVAGVMASGFVVLLSWLIFGPWRRVR